MEVSGFRAAHRPDRLLSVWPQAQRSEGWPSVLFGFSTSDRCNPDLVGDGVTEFALGDHVAALTTFGGYAEYIYLRQDKLVHVPTALAPAEVATLILNYLVAYQVLHRVAQVKTGDRVLIIGASGGVGTAFLQLGKLANLTMYGLAPELL